jgi:hypothetical protein
MSNIVEGGCTGWPLFEGEPRLISEERPVDNNITIRVLGLVSGQPTGFDGQYVVEADACRDGVEPRTRQPMTAYLLTTPDIELATKFTTTEAFELWRSIDKRKPWRPDGKPNRPFTAFSVEFNPYPGGQTGE